ncbi:MAG: HAMP domain-containing histidine kinase [Bacteroidales bacterium]|nr:HAMP domain-containing histidine kinase [Bacteroidales bacterium]
MKLLNKTIIYYVGFSLIVFTFGGVLLYQIANYIVIKQISRSLMFEEQLIEDKLLLYGEVPEFTTSPEHIIQVTYSDEPLKQLTITRDTTISHPFTGITGRYLYLKETGSIRDEQGFFRGYTINVYRSMADSKRLVLNLIMIIWIVLALLLLVLGIFNFWISRKLWKPFYSNIDKLSSFNINMDSKLRLEPTKIYEFDRLNRVVMVMSDKILKNIKELKELIEDITHEIKTPVTIINSRIEMIFQSDKLNNYQLKQLGSIQEAAKRLSRLNSTLNLISDNRDHTGTIKENVDLTTIIDKFLDNFQDLIERKEIKVEKTYNYKPILILKPDLAEIMVSNLLGNAIKHNVKGGIIIITIDEKELSISNTGQQDIYDPEKLFGRYQKNTINNNSLGIGLTIIQKIVQLYGMHISYMMKNNMHVIRLRF